MFDLKKEKKLLESLHTYISCSKDAMKNALIGEYCFYLSLSLSLSISFFLLQTVCASPALSPSSSSSLSLAPGPY